MNPEPSPLLLECPQLTWESSTLETTDHLGRTLRLQHHEAYLDDRVWTLEQGQRTPSRRRVSLYYTVTGSRVGVVVNVLCPCKAPECFAYRSHLAADFERLEALIAHLTREQVSRWHAGLEWHCRIAWEQHLVLKAEETQGVTPRRAADLQAVAH